MNTKKYLYATTAIIGATAMATGAQAQGLELNVGGFTTQYYGIADYDFDSSNNPNASTPPSDETREIAMQEVELRLTGSYTLDNGVEVGAFISNEIEGNAAEADEQYVYLSGSFGTLQLGAQNGAAYITNAGGAQAYAAGVPVNSGWGVIQDLTNDYADFGNSFGGFRTPGVSTFLDLVNDANGVVYKTPRVAGFQLAGSWHPDSGSTTALTSQDSATGDFFSQVDDNADENNAISVGANFSRDFQGIGIDASAGFATEDRPGAEDPEQYQFSLGVSAAGFSFGGGIGIQDSGVDLSQAAGNFNNDVSFDGESYSLGGAYSAGPWTLGVNGIYSEIEGDPSIDGDDERLAITGGLDYAMGPGVTLASGITYAEFDNEEGTGSDGLAGTLGATISF